MPTTVDMGCDIEISTRAVFALGGCFRCCTRLAPAGQTLTVNSKIAMFLVAATSGMVLVLEIIAGRLMAPYVGVSLDTFTGIIGTILAGMAIGAAVGGALADRRDPLRLIAQALFYGGALTWLSIPIVSAMGPEVGSGPVAIVVLAASGFVLPSAVLSGIGPMVAKLQLDSIDETGAVMGRLSAASTFGALMGTFGTGFILISLFRVRTIIVIIGAILVIAGLVVFSRTGKRRPDAVEVGLIAATAFISLAVASPCDFETDYYCVRVVADAIEGADPRPGGRSLIIDQLRHAHVDLDDPEYLDIRYMRLFADVAATLPEGPIDVLHVGGGGFSLPRYLRAVRPGSTNTVLELDADLVQIAKEELGLTNADALDIRTGDARLHLGDLPTNGYDLIVGDAYSGRSVPWHLTTVEVMAEFRRLLKDDGLYMMNVIDGGDNDFMRSQLTTLREDFAQLVVIEPEGGVPANSVNQVIVAASGDIPEFEVASHDGSVLRNGAVIEFIGDDTLVLTDNYAPTDQLLQ